MKKVTGVVAWVLASLFLFTSQGFAGEGSDQNDFEEYQELNLTQMPEEVQATVLRFLSVRDLVRVSGVNTTFHRLVNDPYVVDPREILQAKALAQLGIQVVSLPGGTFQMGVREYEARAQRHFSHEVTLSPFQVMDTHLTRAQAKALGISPQFTNCHMSEKEKLEWDLYPNHPLTCISWEDVDQKIIPAFKARGFQVRMMTDAEAEYLMRLQGKERVITATDFPWGDDPSQLGEYGWYLENSRRAVLDVKTALKTSSEGLYDTRGNVDSWVKDWWMNESTKGPIENPQGPEFGFFRIVRGGSFDSTSRRLSSKERGCKVPEYRSNSVSVRLVIE